LDPSLKEENTTKKRRWENFEKGFEEVSEYLSQICKLLFTR
jgi:hypothetical protein